MWEKAEEEETRKYGDTFRYNICMKKTIFRCHYSAKRKWKHCCSLVNFFWWSISVHVELKYRKEIKEWKKGSGSFAYNQKFNASLSKSQLRADSQIQPISRGRFKREGAVNRPLEFENLKHQPFSHIKKTNVTHVWDGYWSAGCAREEDKVASCHRLVLQYFKIWLHVHLSLTLELKFMIVLIREWASLSPKLFPALPPPPSEMGVEFAKKRTSLCHDRLLSAIKIVGRKRDGVNTKNIWYFFPQPFLQVRKVRLGAESGGDGPLEKVRKDWS